MKKLQNRKELLEVIKDLLAVENIAREDYISNIERFKDVGIVDTYQKIKAEEDLHIEILNKTVKMIESLE